MRTPVLRRCTSSALALLLTSIGLGQVAETLVLEGQVIPGLGAVESVEKVFIRDDGSWLARIRIDTAPFMDGVVLHDGAVVWQENDPAANGDVAQLITGIVTGSGGVLYSMYVDTPGLTPSVYFDTNLLLQTRDQTSAPTATPGTWYATFFFFQNAGDLVLMRGYWDTPAHLGINNAYAVVLELDATGNLLAESLVVEAGQIPPGQTEPVSFMVGPHSAAINGAGDVMWTAGLSGDSALRHVTYVNDTLLVQSGTPSPVEGRDWGWLFSDRAVDLNDQGQWVVRDKLDDSQPATDDVIVRQGLKYLQEGDSIPAIGPSVFRGSSNGPAFGRGPLDLSNDGDLLYFGRWDGPLTSREGLFLNGKLIVREGVTRIDGLTVTELGDRYDDYFISDNGRWVIFQAELTDEREGVFRIDLALGSSYCVATPNSTGSGATIAAIGTASVARNDLTLRAVSVPAGQSGVFYYGPNQAQVPFGNGFRCVGGTAVFRLGVESADAWGHLDHDLDNTDPPQPSGRIAPGSTFHFQGWYRDPAAGGAFFNLTDAVSLTFTL